MPICPSCNRDTSCLHANSVTTNELYFLIGFIVFVSQLAFVVLTNQESQYDLYNTSIYGSFALIIILFFMILMYFIKDKQYLAVFFGCHQQLDRSYTVLGKPFILCARCSGLVVGMLLSPILFLFSIPLWIFLVIAIPLIVDGTIQRVSSYESNNITRLITGILFAPLIVIIFSYTNLYIHLGFTYLANVVISFF